MMSRYYLVPGQAEPVTLGGLRALFHLVSWANEDAGGPDDAALTAVGVTRAPDRPAMPCAWDGHAWVPVPVEDAP